MEVYWFMAGIVIGLVVAWFASGVIYRKRAAVREAEVVEENRQDKQALQSAREAHEDAIERLARAKAKESTVLERVEILEADISRSRKELVRVKASYAEAGTKAEQLQLDQTTLKASLESAEGDRNEIARELQKARVHHRQAVENQRSVTADLEARLRERDERIVDLEAQLASVQRETPDNLSAPRGDPAVKTVPRYGAPDPRSEKADDLTRIKGIGPVLKDKLIGLGITSFRQIAEFTPADVDRVTEVLDFPGRIERERWVEQAREIVGR
jgi:predicted flap endonuclease-1-like 5' DNA nuclease